jgi:hypothetical protein
MDMKKKLSKICTLKPVITKKFPKRIFFPIKQQHFLLGGGGKKNTIAPHPPFQTILSQLCWGTIQYI